MARHKKFINAVENVVVIAIVLVLIHTLLQYFGDLLRWTWSTRTLLIYIGCAFDIFFSIEFSIRLLTAVIKRRPLYYLRDQKGWVDFVASVPLLVLSSGPAAISAYTDTPTIATVAGVFGVLKIVKVIRIARILRLLRLLKIFKHIKHVDSVMAQRHVSRIATTAVTTMIITLVLFSVVVDTLHVPNLETVFGDFTVQALDNRIHPQLGADEVAELADLRPDILIIKEGGETVYSRHANSYYDDYYGPADYTLLTYPAADIEVYIDLLPLVSNSARSDILHYFLIVAVILVVLFIYGPHFATSLSDPIQIMIRGFSKKSHSSQIVVSKRYGKDEVYELSQLYNDVFLPLKDRVEGGLQDATVTDLNIEDIQKLFDE